MAWPENTRHGGGAKREFIESNTIDISEYFELLESADKCKGKWKYEQKNIYETLYIVSIRMSGEILENRNVRDDTGPMEIKVTCLLKVVRSRST